jgi:hypothetical protein
MEEARRLRGEDAALEGAVSDEELVARFGDYVRGRKDAPGGGKRKRPRDA